MTGFDENHATYSATAAAGADLHDKFNDFSKRPSTPLP